ncbi:MAG: hypothetical protein ACP5E3_11245 [Bacteroidales bacterium]
MRAYLFFITFSFFTCAVTSLFAQSDTYWGTYAGNGQNYNNNTTIGYYAGDIVTGANNSILGANSGRSLTSGADNVFIGSSAGRYNTTGRQNVFIGFTSGYFNTTGYYNTFIGNRSGFYNSSGIGNTTLGWYSGFTNSTGEYNVFLGYQAGRNSTGSRNVFIGLNAGYYETGSHKLYIDNTTTSTPLIYGEFDNDLVAIGGRLGINTQNIPDSIQLAVNGTMMAKEVIITVDNFPDYVFSEDYDLRTLEEVDEFIKENGHLPEVPSAEEVARTGMKMGEMEKILLKKVEELSLYVIDLKTTQDQLKKELSELEENDQ